MKTLVHNPLGKRGSWIDPIGRTVQYTYNSQGFLSTATDAGGPANFLTDALGSTIALTGPTGNTLSLYTYDPYGNMTVTGSSSNPYQYTGRENDGTGLYYYRGRYYNPTFQRFISEDPIGFRDSLNFYSYVLDAPVDFRDPAGTQGWENVYNNPIVDWIANNADCLPGICSGGFFLYVGGGPQVGPVYQGTYGFWDWNVDFEDPFHPTVHANPTAALVEAGAEIPGGEAGVGSVVGRKGIQENFLFTGPKAGPFAGGPLVGASTANGPNPLYNDRYIGLFGEVSSHWVPGTGLVGRQGAIGGGVYLTVQSASQCVKWACGAYYQR